MQPDKKEKLKRFIEIIKTTPKLRGMKIIYKEFGVHKYQQGQWRKFWDELEKYVKKDEVVNGGNSTNTN